MYSTRAVKNDEAHIHYRSTRNKCGELINAVTEIQHCP